MEIKGGDTIIIYNTNNGKVIAQIPDNQPYDYLDGNNSHLILDEIPSAWREHKVSNGKLVKLTEIELKEINNFGEILSEEKRQEINLLRKLTPTQKEIEDAEKTIDIANFIQEVM